MARGGDWRLVAPLVFKTSVGSARVPGGFDSHSPPPFFCAVQSMAKSKSGSGEAGVLSALAFSRPNHVHGLGRELGLGRQTIVNVTKRLKDLSCVERSSSIEDARSTVFAIPEAGQRKLDEVEGIAPAFEAQLRNEEGGDQETNLTPALRRIVEAPFLAYMD